MTSHTHFEWVFEFSESLHHTTWAPDGVRGLYRVPKRRNFYLGPHAKSAYKTGYWEHLRALICGVGQLPYCTVGAKALEVGEKSIGKLSIDPDGPAVGPTLAGAPLPRTPRDGRRTGVFFLPQFSTSRSPLSNR